jgi:RNA polymerase sigma factor (sigma-70 family)
LITWLYQIIHGKTADYWRKQDPRTVSLETLAHDNPAFVTRAIDRDETVAVQQALSCLAPEEQILLLLHDSERHTLVEIGHMVGLRKSAVAERLARAREHFRCALRDGGKFSSPKRLKE